MRVYAGICGLSPQLPRSVQLFPIVLTAYNLRPCTIREEVHAKIQMYAATGDRAEDPKSPEVHVTDSIPLALADSVFSDFGVNYPATGHVTHGVLARSDRDQIVSVSVRL